MYRCRVLTSSEQSEFLPLALPHLRGSMAEGGRPFVTVGAESNGRAVGLAVSEPGNGTARIHSLLVAPEYRRRGIGRSLLEETQSLLRLAGAQSIEGRFVPQAGECEGIAPLLQGCGWAPPERCALLARTDHATLSQAPFMRDLSFPESFEVFPWKDLTAADRGDIARRQQERPWYPEFLSPFSLEKELISMVSLGLRYRGEVVGWSISHPLSRGVLRYAKLFVRQDLQLRGRGITLLAHSLYRSPMSGFLKFFFDVALENTAMVRFVERRMRPYLHRISYILRATKQLAPAVIQ